MADTPPALSRDQRNALAGLARAGKIAADMADEMDKGRLPSLRGPAALRVLAEALQTAARMRGGDFDA